MAKLPTSRREKPAAAPGNAAAGEQDVFARQEDLFTVQSAERPES